MNAEDETGEETRGIIEALESTGDFRVLRRFVPAKKFQRFETDQERSKSKVALVFACKTTGRNVQNARLVQLSYAMVRFSSETGVIYEVESVYTGMEDPGAPISERIESDIGISDAELRGKSFDSERINADIKRAVVLISHNAESDRRFVEARFEEVSDKWFVSSQQEAPWEKYGSASRNLDFLAFTVAGLFLVPGEHILEVQTLVELLTRKTPEGRHVLLDMLNASRVPTWRVWACASNAEQKRVLFERGYRMVESITREKEPIKGWSRIVRSLDRELAFLAEKVYSAPVEIRVEQISGQERYSDKPGKSQIVLVSTESAKGYGPAAVEARSPVQHASNGTAAETNNKTRERPVHTGDFPI